MNTYILIIALICFLVVGGYMLLKKKKKIQKIYTLDDNGYLDFAKDNQVIIQKSLDWLYDNENITASGLNRNFKMGY
ncbi:MAG: LPXTG cell wall anchor domain-containing protein [Flavobacteriaceae bacterium]|nr:LPXTG cell wall anchor domain-containing protein [Flavobacteriaceae bacterium]